MAYAAQTTVTVERSKAELEALLGKHGADHFAYATNSEGAEILFKMSERYVRFRMPMPQLDEFASTGGRYPRRRTAAQAQAARDQETRRRWRALVLIVKAKLEAVAAGVSTFEREFLSDVLLRDGRTVYEWFMPQLEEHYKGGEMPASLPLAALSRGE